MPKTSYFLYVMIVFAWSAALITAPSNAAEQVEQESLSRNLIAAAEVYDEEAIASICEQFVSAQAQSIDSIINLISDANSVVRWKAIEILNRIRPVPTTRRETLRRILVKSSLDADRDVRAATAICIATWFADHRETARIVRRLRTDSNAVVQANACRSDWSLRQDRSALEQLARLLGGRDWLAADTAELHLSEIGHIALPTLLEATKQACDSQVSPASQRVRYIRTLGQVGRNDDTARRFFVSLLGHSDRQIVSAAATALVPHGQAASKPLMRLVSSTDSRDQAIGLNAIVRLDAAIPNCERIEELIDCDVIETRLAAIRAIPSVCQPTSRRLDAYAKLLMDDNSDVRAAAASAVMRWRTGAATLREPLLRIATTDEKDFVRQVARKSILAISAAPTAR